MPECLKVDCSKPALPESAFCFEHRFLDPGKTILFYPHGLDELDRSYKGAQKNSRIRTPITVKKVDLKLPTIQYRFRPKPELKLRGTTSLVDSTEAQDLNRAYRRAQKNTRLAKHFSFEKKLRLKK